MSLVTTENTSPPHVHIHAHAPRPPPSSPSSLLSLLVSPTLLPSYPRLRRELFFSNLVASWRISACLHMHSGLHLSPLCGPQTVCTVCLLACFFANSHTPLNTRKERGEKWSTDSCFGWFSMETFVQLANAGLPTRPVLQLWNERRNISLWPQWKRSEPNLAPTYMHSNTFICTNRGIGTDFVICAPAHNLLAGARVSPKSWWRMVSAGFMFWPQRKEIHETVAHQWKKKAFAESFYWVKDFCKLLSRFTIFNLWVGVTATAGICWRT